MSYHLDLARDVYGDRPWILAVDVLAAASHELAALSAAGVERVLVIAGSRGTGPVADHDAVVLGVAGSSVMDAIHGLDRALADPAPAVLGAVARFDPGARAKVIPPMFSQLSTVAGRRVWGARPAPWLALEDKTTVDQVWHAAGVPRAPAMVVPAAADALRRAASALDSGGGTVWVADNRAGWHGGAAGLRWVRGEDQLSDAVAFMCARADRVRVMPFLAGVPCSIHGMVLPDATIAFRPCEMVVLGRTGRSDLCYAGMASTWDPPREDRRQMRAHARRVGEYLRTSVGYRGAFSIDGIMTAEGFRPTELNPRFGAALAMLTSATEVPLYLLHLAAVEGVDVEWRADALERAVLDVADVSREARCHLLVNRPLAPVSQGLRDDGAGLVATSADADLVLHAGPSPVGGIIIVEVADDAVVPGASVAPRAAAALAWADRRWGLGLGPVEPARDVRRRG